MNDFLLMLYWELLPMLLQLIGAVLGLFLIWAARTAKNRWGIEIEARHREALHSAIMSGIRASLSRGTVGEDAINEAILHAGSSVPDAIAALNPGAGVLVSIAEAKLREAIEASPVYRLDGNPAAWPAGVARP
ncbi:hypothetical protein [Pseudotabrizicola algicola]|uniref:Uncharacterized protein n=1 Tax=Pseudotabrizicola algicola TaxID=2709381 RepID=A0A6B3RS07_9RHOB|nr:hypothetical protein [Pseudotabrizicola algicola]NEX47618.1 hypothetical protein [Pseudotabrizicola algicola]